MIIEAFHGAPYSVYACFDGSRAETIDNIHFLQSTKAELLPGSIACIHDGKYRLLLSDDKYYYYTQAYKKITLASGDLSMLLNYLSSSD